MCFCLVKYSFVGGVQCSVYPLNNLEPDPGFSALTIGGALLQKGRKLRSILINLGCISVKDDQIMHSPLRNLMIICCFEKPWPVNSGPSWLG